ncbi:MAG: hypothetical protein GEU95_01215 [Rhizobiales bacterium]|nr:hypothetical protein [Hyphomicrobiales bacterium]
MTGEELLTRAATVLQDIEHVRWPLPELVRWVNDGMRATVLAKPSANSATVALTLVEGTLQSLVDDAHLLLLRMPRNLKQASPPIGGRAIRPTNREVLDASEPSWHDRSVVPFKKEVRQYVYDEANPRGFYCYPGNDGTGIVEAVVSLLPTLLTASGDPDVLASYSAELGLPETYGVIVLDYVLYRSYSKDDVGADPGRAQMHYQAFASALGIKLQVEGASSPNSRAKIAST